MINHIKIGMEQEYFILGNKGFATAKEAGLENDMDACGYLAEARGEPDRDPIKASFNLLYAKEILKTKIKKGFFLETFPRIAWKELDKRKIQREYGKGIAKDKSVYGKEVKEFREPMAGLHIHFSDYEEIPRFNSDGEYTGKEKEHKQLDMPYIITQLDKKYKEGILKHNRQLGIYEIKPHGFEYRSLPTNTNLRTLSENIKEIIKCI